MLHQYSSDGSGDMPLVTMPAVTSGDSGTPLVTMPVVASSDGAGGMPLVTMSAVTSSGGFSDNTANDTAV